MNGDLELITKKQIRESERIRKLLEDLRPKQKEGYYSSGGGLRYYKNLINPEPFY